jgi:endonuclease III
MVDPHNPIKFDRTKSELEEWFLFSIIVAGKRASFGSEKAERVINESRSFADQVGIECGKMPLDALLALARREVNSGLKLVRPLLMKVRTGKYDSLSKAFIYLAENPLDFSTCTLDDLEKIPGVGPKTARMFLLHSRSDQQYAALDTHILAHLRENGIDAPKATPSSSRKYKQLEDEFLKLAESKGMTPSDYDIMIWKEKTLTKPAHEVVSR